MDNEGAGKNPPCWQPFWLKAIFRAIIWISFGGYDVRGIENVPREGPLILVATHRSYLDPILLGAFIPRRIHFLAKRELFEKAHHRLVNTMFGGFSVNREKPQGSTFRTALQILRAGGAVTLFPEGGIVDTLGQKGFKGGVGTLATMSGAAILPIYITGSNTLIDMQRVLSDRSFLAIRVGKLLRPELGRGREAREHAARLAEESLRNLEREYLASNSKIPVEKAR